MLDNIRNLELRTILSSRDLSRADRINKLTKMRDDARAEQRMASEGPSIDDDGLNSNLREIELVLAHLGQSPAEEEGKGPASL